MITPFTANELLVEPLPNLAAWTAFFCRTEIPVMRETAETLEALRNQEDANDANSIGEMLSGDPLMTAKVLAYEAAHRGSRVVTAAETVTAAIVMMGVTPFFHGFGRQPIVEDLLIGNGPALGGLKRMLSQARRGADFAFAFAAHRADPHAAIIHAAALLHDLAEILLWCHAPSLALAVAALQQTDATLTSSAAQRQVLNIDLMDLQANLVSSWKLPVLLTEVNVGARINSQIGARTISLANRLVRDIANGRKTGSAAEDLEEIAHLLGLSADATILFIEQI